MHGREQNGSRHHVFVRHSSRKRAIQLVAVACVALSSFRGHRSTFNACAAHTPPSIAIASRQSTFPSFLCLGPFCLRRHQVLSHALLRRLASPPLCLAPRRDLTLDITSSPCIAMDFVQTPAYSSHHCSPFSGSCAILVSVYAFPLSEFVPIPVLPHAFPFIPSRALCSLISDCSFACSSFGRSLVDYKCSGCI